MDNLKDTFEKIANSLNPIKVSWSNSGDAIEYILKIGILVLVVVAIVAAIYYFPRLVKFLRATQIELKLVTWLSRRNTYKYTVISLAMLIAGTLFIILVDRAFLSIKNLLILRDI